MWETDTEMGIVLEEEKKEESKFHCVTIIYHIWKRIKGTVTTKRIKKLLTWSKL